MAGVCRTGRGGRGGGGRGRRPYCAETPPLCPSTPPAVALPGAGAAARQRTSSLALPALHSDEVVPKRVARRRRSAIGCELGLFILAPKRALLSICRNPMACGNPGCGSGSMTVGIKISGSGSGRGHMPLRRATGRCRATNTHALRCPPLCFVLPSRAPTSRSAAGPAGGFI